MSCKVRFLTRLYLQVLTNASTQKNGAVVNVFEGDVQAAFLVHVVRSYRPASGLFAWHKFEPQVYG